MKHLLYLFFILLLPQAVFAEAVSRTVDTDGTFINISLTPDPYNNFSMPGWYAEEIIPAGTRFISTNADWSKLDGTTLKVLRFIPSEGNVRINYSVIILERRDSYRLDGTFKDALRNPGLIPAMSVSYNYTIIPENTSTNTSTNESTNDSSNNSSGNWSWSGGNGNGNGGTNPSSTDAPGLSVLGDKTVSLKGQQAASMPENTQPRIPFWLRLTFAELIFLSLAGIIAYGEYRKRHEIIEPGQKVYRLILPEDEPGMEHEK